MHFRIGVSYGGHYRPEPVRHFAGHEVGVQDVLNGELLQEIGVFFVYIQGCAGLQSAGVRNEIRRRRFLEGGPDRILCQVRGHVSFDDV